LYLETFNRPCLANSLEGLDDKLGQGDGGKFFCINFKKEFAINFSCAVEVSGLAARLFLLDGGSEGYQPLDDELADHLCLLHFIQFHEGLEYLL
jgi:hypothetical protein